MTNYKLVNPYIGGGLKNSYSGSSPAKVAEEVWDNVSGYLTGNLPKFAFTIQRESDRKLFHYMVKESVKGDVVDFSINKLDIKLNKKAHNTFLKKIEGLNEVSQNGGKKKKDKDDDDDSSSSESDDYKLYEKVLRDRSKHQNKPIVYWWYTPTLYEYYVGSVFVPTFVVPLTPYVEIYPLSTAFWG